MSDTSPAAPVFFASAPLNVEDLLEKEVREAGGTPLRVHRTGVEFSGSLEAAYRLCLWSRIASRVMLQLKDFECPDLETLYNQVAAHPWEEELDPALTVAVEVTQKACSLGENRFLTLKVKDAVVDRLRSKTGGRPDVDTDNPDYRIHLHLQGSRGTLSFDLSGDSLHRRGYRKETGPAPLKENSAAALLYRGGWDRLYPEGAPLLDPMCGSGTLLIEGALMAADIAPGLFRRTFGFSRWKKHDRTLWEALVKEARDRRDRGLRTLPPIRGFDRDSRVIKAAWANITAAGLGELIHVERQELKDLRPTEALKTPGLMAVNPPYGLRLEEEKNLAPLYSLLGTIMKEHFPGWKGVVLTSGDSLARATGIKADKINTLYNGSVKCIALAFTLYSRDERTALTERELPPLSPGAQMFANRLTKNLKHRGKWARRNNITSYRLYDADLPEYAVALDFYEGQWVHLQEYAPPAEIPEEKAETRRREILKAVPRVLELDGRHIYFKTRQRQRGSSQYGKVGTAGEKFIMNEGGLKFLVNFTDYLDTGIFLDHRITRGIIRERAADKRFLNLFAYTGSATVYAAAGGASSTTTVDASATYLAWARENLELNKLSGKHHQFIQADCLEWIAREKNRYDLIFLDPPTFSNSKSRSTTFDIQRDQVGLLRDTLGLLAPGGTLIFSNNYRKFKLEEEALEGYKVEEITGQTVPEDFQQRKAIHRCWVITNSK